MLKKILFFANLIFILLLFSPKYLLASEEFIVDSEVTYEIEESGTTNVTHNISLQNQVSDLYATSYSLELTNIKPENIRSFSENHNYQINVKEDFGKTTITTNFDDALVGKGKTRNFSITFSENSFAARTGEIWEISIPRISQESIFRNYSLVIKVPKSFGSEAYISPDPNSIEYSDDLQTYIYNQENAQEFGITAGFGNFQVFSFTLNYHLENPLNSGSEVEIAIPPDTAYQKLYYEVLSPKPENIKIDPDGNWLAIYKLSPRERLDVSAKGNVQIFAGARPLFKYPKEVLDANLQESEFWQINEPSIAQLAQRLKTPYEIYNFVSNNFKYDFKKVSPETKRLGAKQALENPNSAICMEYTDAFVAITRAAGIPAREINGYAYTENPEIQPLSLVSDVLHAWPEYWDDEKGVWIPIDPTWASTTGGVDYFNKLDLRHFTFVIHGVDSTKPFPPGSYKLGPNPQKDVFVNFGQLPDKKVSIPETMATIEKSPGLFGKNIQVKIFNSGPVALYNLSSEVLYDSKVAQKVEIDILPPFASYTYESYMQYGILGVKAPEKITIVTLDQKIEIPTNKSQIITYNLALILFLILLFLSIIILRLKKINPFKFFTFILMKAKNSLYEIFKKNKNNKENI